MANFYIVCKSINYKGHLDHLTTSQVYLLWSGTGNAKPMLRTSLRRHRNQPPKSTFF